MKKAVYAGSFDPITNGHLWMIREGMKLFDELIVAIGINPEKHYFFSLQERLRMLEETIGTFPSVRIDHFHNQFLVRYAENMHAAYILRGIRNEYDYSYERGMRYINSDLQANIQTVFLIPPREIAEVSSSFVKGLVGPQGWQDIVHQYIPDAVFKLFLRKVSHEI